MTNQGGCGGRRLGACGAYHGLAIEIMMVGRIFEREAGCKCRECCVCEEKRPSVDEGSGSNMAQRCWSVTYFCSGKVGDERNGFLTPAASHFDS